MSTFQNNNSNNNNDHSNEEPDDTVPLLSGQNSINSLSNNGSIAGSNRNKRKTKRERRRRMRAATEHHKFPDDNNNDGFEDEEDRDVDRDQDNYNSVTDFDQADSWGMLHESDVGYDAVDNEGFIDHRQSINQMMDRPKKYKPSTTTQGVAHSVPSVSIEVPSHFDKKEGFKKSPFGQLSPSQLEDLVRRNENWKHMSKHESTGNIYPTSPSKMAHDAMQPEHRRNTYANSDVVIDVDALMQHVHEQASSHNNIASSVNHSISQPSGTSLDDVEEDEYNSRPSSRGSSSNSSLDDVCLPMEESEEDDEEKEWPDISVLEEFSQEEIERLRKQAIQDAEAFHFQYDETDEEALSLIHI